MNPYKTLTFISLMLFSISSSYSQDSTTIKLPGLIRPVTILKDQWGISHIYATNEQDLFFTQGYNAAKDRLFQFELFRRQATGTAAEILGARELKRDIGARLFKYRGDINKDMKQYHPRGDVIIKSFVKGINTYIKQVLDDPELLPLEFQWLGIKPGYWTPEVVISRHNGLLGNIQEELNTARAVSQIGVQRVQDMMNYHPHLPSLSIDAALTKEALKEDILALYDAYRKPIQFIATDLIGTLPVHSLQNLNAQSTYASTKSYEGSNNWVIHGQKSYSGFPMLANDPHRAITVPSLRYITHLNAPGWNVIGGGEPILPGISIGHNEYGAWGLTIFETDIEDLIVYTLNPKNNNQYLHQGKWLTFKTIPDTIKIKNASAHVVRHHYTIDGPVPFMDTLRHLAYGVRCAWLEPGSAPYLASLRMDQSKTWEEFKKACTYAFVPAENMVWADRKGNIGWQTVGIAPIRLHHSGMVPVLNENKYAWAGYLPILQRPSRFNPKEGYLATANENLTPIGYPYLNSIGYSWADPYRGQRIREVLKEKNKMTTQDFERLQTDYTAVPARTLVPMISAIQWNDPSLDSIKQSLLEWNQILSPESGMAGLYVLIERTLEVNILKQLIPENYDTDQNNNVPVTSLSTAWILKHLETNPLKEEILKAAFIQSVQAMKDKFGSNTDLWKYGDVDKFKHVFIQHTLSKIVNDREKNIMNIRSMPRGGNGNTIGSTGDNDNQSSGASFRVVMDCANWDQAKAINTPGQSGNPIDPHYRDLFELWSKDQYFPLYYSKKRVHEVTEHIFTLKPER